MKPIEQFDTVDLVNELSKREGVRRMETPVEGQDEIAIEKIRDKPSIGSIKDNYLYDEVKSGPATILRIID